MTEPSSTVAEKRLPSPADRPAADVIIFDGHCRMCTGQILRLAACDLGKRLAYFSLHDPEVSRRYPDLSHDALMREMYVVDRQGRRHAGPQAIKFLSRKLPLLWPLAPLLHVPGTGRFWNWLYRQVAERRYRFGRLDDCPDGSCSLHR